MAEWGDLLAKIVKIYKNGTNGNLDKPEFVGVNVMKIKSYTPEYRNQIISLILYIQNYEQRVNLSLEEQPDMADIQKYYQMNGGDFWIAIDDSGDVIGTLGLMKKEKHYGILKKFFVKPEFRGSKIGTANNLYYHLITKAKELGIDTIILDTPLACNRAHSFYRKHNFVEIPKEQLPIKYDYPDRDSLLFIKKI